MSSRVFLLALALAGCGHKIPQEHFDAVNTAADSLCACLRLTPDKAVPCSVVANKRAHEALADLDSSFTGSEDALDSSSRVKRRAAMDRVTQCVSMMSEAHRIEPTPPPAPAFHITDAQFRAAMDAASGKKHRANARK